MTLTVIALGGNALQSANAPFSIEALNNAISQTAGILAPCLKHPCVLVHGNGPQVGALALMQPSTPLDLLVAQTQALIGIPLANALQALSPDLNPWPILTEVDVDANDPAFATPNKPIGQWLAPEQRQSTFTYIEKDGRYRRVVPSPKPQAITPIEAVIEALEQGRLPIVAGGGGIPVVTTAQGRQRVEAVVDKDLSAAEVATRLGATRLVILTDVPGVYQDYPSPCQSLIRESSIDALDWASFEAGSMRPKLEAIATFLKQPQAKGASLGALNDAAGVLAGTHGSHFS